MITKSKIQEIIKEELLNEYVEYERLDDLEARIFDQIMEFKKPFERSCNITDHFIILLYHRH